MSYSSKSAVKQLRRVPDTSKEPVLAYLVQSNQQWQKRLREGTCRQWTSLNTKYEDFSGAAWWRTGSEVGCAEACFTSRKSVSDQPPGENPAATDEMYLRRSARMQLDRTSVPWVLFCCPNAVPCKMVHKWLMAFSAGCDAATTGGPVFLCFFLWVDPRRNGVV
ncbi:hypothetical protein NA56DRAFT_699727 [Hyaloscypha hepaticicola]|uniref:Uncharacterized protein n=1 Tax=Hyaloscypha hepaticicola TaxID=2082293 RepID=A0A2J6QF83_9HELO|nr:hypothetical protein NA56DRAFT_699727 [Hyaloscypha hepaticicola]